MIGKKREGSENKSSHGLARSRRLLLRKIHQNFFQGFRECD
ncbi:hypothetical protein B4135_1506 [Caldibacillus debilis]|uniref:Uncharacterized protein n=1 Tax=Caldibacillus debilis TaxID=301148 RepID=A0A150MCK6_9BACI|nr:hypothetical protein B4135_1506 [Caldibacillus debilis]